MHIYSVNDPEFKSYGNVWDNVPSELTSPVLDDRDVILFPEKIGGKFAMMQPNAIGSSSKGSYSFAIDK